MPRVASLYLPNLPIDRLRRLDGTRADKQPDPVRAPAPLPNAAEAEAKIGARIGDCSCPRGGGWRPGARWARGEEVQAEIAALPSHQHPPMRELGRRTEGAPVVFRQSRSRPLRDGISAEQGAAPMVTTHRLGQRVVIAAASPEAQAIGIEPGMPLTQARVTTPGLDIRDAEPEADAAWLMRLALFAARRWTPRVAVAGADGLVLDLTGVTHLFGGERAMCVRILRFCTRLGLTARIAIADSHAAAWALARHGGERILLCPTEETEAALAPLPLAALGVGDDVIAPGRRLGIERVGDVMAMPAAPLARRFGQELLTRLHQALGRAAEAFEPIVPSEPPEALLRLLEPIVTAEAIGQVLSDLMTVLVRTLEEQGLAARMLTLVCLRVDGSEQSLTVGTARATRDGAHLLRLFQMKIETIDPGFGIEAMRLVARRCEPLGPQALAAALDDTNAPPDLVPLIDRLAGRLGPRRLYRFGAVESDVPERSVCRIAPLGIVQSWPRWPRPVRFLSPAERVENVMALLPDGPPRRFTWRGKAHLVRRADGPERIYGEWWKRGGEQEAVRDYFQVEDEEGRRFWLYRRGDAADGRTGDLSWHLQGMFG